MHAGDDDGFGDNDALLTFLRFGCGVNDDFKIYLLFNCVVAMKLNFKYQQHERETERERKKN